ncbi:hypothetical protein MMYC01_200331 [Madurella mycetomatis]|uniref:Uncharacterized protein n=1 Tax=Madurella mycetomatis TaxID=100816 RepID=A0A175WHS3_9PEZI|nr:hypothetical protein MMYC01_200331 [Madurella mycetomatis]
MNEDRTKVLTPIKLDLKAPGLGLVDGAEHKVSLYYNHTDFIKDKRFAAGTIKLGRGIYADWEEVNGDPAEEASADSTPGAEVNGSSGPGPI